MHCFISLTESSYVVSECGSTFWEKWKMGGVLVCSPPFSHFLFIFYSLNRYFKLLLFVPFLGLALFSYLGIALTFGYCLLCLFTFIGHCPSHFILGMALTFGYCLFCLLPRWALPFSCILGMALTFGYCLFCLLPFGHCPFLTYLNSLT